MSSFEVIAAGVLSLLQDNGRFGQSTLGLTTGGAGADHDNVKHFRAALYLCHSAILPPFGQPG